jgi:acyl carrier protein
MTRFPSFEGLAELVRTSLHVKRSERIDPDTQLLRDLKVDGKRALELLGAIEVHFGIQLSPEIHTRFQEIGSIQAKNESPVVQSLFAGSRQDDNPLTVGRLYKAVLEQLNSTLERPVSTG